MADADLDLEAARGQAMMEDAAAHLVEGVRTRGPAWSVAHVTRLVDAWGKLDRERRERLLADAQTAGNDATLRVVGELRVLFATRPAEQRRTPLEVVRTLGDEPTDLLRAVGMPEVERDSFDVRAFPDDVYGLVPRTLGDLGDEDLGAWLLAWGLGKAKVLRIRTPRGDSDKKE